MRQEPDWEAQEYWRKRDTEERQRQLELERAIEYPDEDTEFENKLDEEIENK